MLGLRDVLDDPRIVAAGGTRDDAEQAVRDYYDAVWVLRKPARVRRRAAYCFASDVAEKIQYTGYLQRYGSAGECSSPAVATPRCACQRPSHALHGRRRADGGHVAETFAKATLPRRRRA